MGNKRHISVMEILIPTINLGTISPEILITIFAIIVLLLHVSVQHLLDGLKGGGMQEMSFTKLFLFD